MECMEFIKKRMNKCQTFEELESVMSERKMIVHMYQTISTLNMQKVVKSRDALSAFMIVKFPLDTVGESSIELNKLLIDKATNLVNTDSKNKHDLKMNLLHFIHALKVWKNEDCEILTQQLIHEFHQLSVDIMELNDPNDPRKQIFETCKNDILEIANKIGGDYLQNEILSFTPIVIDKRKLKQQYDNAYWDKISNDYMNQEYDSIMNIFSYIQNSLVASIQLKRSYIQELFDLPYLRHLLDTNNLSGTVLKEFCSKVYDLFKEIQSPIRDTDLEACRRRLHTTANYTIVNALETFISLLTSFTDDLEHVKEYLSK